MRYFLLCLFVCGFIATAIAQKPRYIDYKPSYQVWDERYILDKISYWKNRTVFHFRYAAYPYKGSMSLHGPLSYDKWSLVNTANPSEVFDEIELQKVTREGYITHEVYRENFIAFRTKPYEIYTVEVHFPALPAHITEVDFLEGIAKRTYSNHFHCFKVKVKPFKDKDLGTKEDLKNRIDAFEIHTLGWAKTSSGHINPPQEILPESEPKPEAKPEPKPLPKKPEEQQAEGGS